MDCTVCLTQRATVVCGTCKVIPYCSRVCADRHWSDTRLFGGHVSLCQILVGDGLSLNPECLRGYQIMGLIASGGHGSVWVTCVRGDCKYAMKIQTIKDDLMGEKEWDIVTEMYHVMRFSQRYGIGPKFHDAWICDGGMVGIIVTARWDDTLKMGETISHELVNKLQTQIQTLHTGGFLHLDVLPKNVLVMRNRGGRVKDLTLADFGLVERMPFPRGSMNHIWVQQLYNYHRGVLPQYFKRNHISVEDVIEDAGILDGGLVWMLRTPKNQGGWL